MTDRAIVDASVVLDSAGDGPAFDLFALLHERCEVSAPQLLAWEVGNVVHGRLASRFGASAPARHRAVEAMLAGIDLRATDVEARKGAGDIARRHGLTFYDASYLDLALRTEGAILLSHDRALVSVAKRALGAERVGMLADLTRLLSQGEG